MRLLPLLLLAGLLLAGCGGGDPSPTSTSPTSSMRLPQVQTGNGYTEIDAEAFLTDCLAVDAAADAPRDGRGYCQRLYDCFVEAVDHDDFTTALDRLRTGGLPAATSLGRRPITGCYMSAVRAYPALVAQVHGDEIAARFHEGCVSPLRTQGLAEASAQLLCTRAYRCLVERLTLPGVVRVSFAGVRLTRAERTTIRSCQRVGARGVPGVGT